MKAAILSQIKQFIQRTGYEVVRVKKQRENFSTLDFDQEFILLYAQIERYTMTSKERVYALYEAIKYIISNNIPGDIVECGVWRGGSMMTTAHTLLARGDNKRLLYLFDTFEGMPPPSEQDRLYTGQTAASLLADSERSLEDVVWAYSPLDQVQENLHSTGYPQERIVFIKGKVEDTLPDKAPQQIALLRLDTDWYGSTYHELSTLYPRLVHGGVLIIDDYGWWQGARQAVDQYFSEQYEKPLLCRIDDTGRICVKTSI